MREESGIAATPSTRPLRSAPAHEEAAREEWPGRRRERLLVLAVVGLLAAGSFLGVGGVPAGEATLAAGRPPAWLLPLDDAYIFVRYAQQASRGAPFEWTEGVRSSGSSALVFPWLLVPGQWLGGGLAAASWWSRAVGVACLALLGLAAIRALRGAGLPDPWPAAGGLALLLSGPLAFATLAGMETGLACAALAAVAAAWTRRAAPGAPGRGGALPLVGVALLPWVRPELAVLAAGVAALVALGRWPGVPRGASPLVVAPALAFAALNLWLTGEAQPAGAVSKSLTEAPFLGPTGVAAGWWTMARAHLFPVYLGQRPELLPPGVGLGAAAAAGASLAAWWPTREAGALRARLRALAPLGVAWLVLFLLAPFSVYLHWQGMRHHHPGLALAWLLFGAGLALVAERAFASPSLAPRAPRLRRLALLLPLLLVPLALHWVRAHGEAARDLARRNGPAAAWLMGNARDRVLLLNDAGLLALAHDGPAVDLVGLGSPDFLRPFRHGGGALAETLARHEPAPEIAALNPNLARMPGLLADPLIPPPPLPPPGALDTRLLLARVREDVLSRTALSGAGVDFAHLPSEAGAELRWSPPPGTDQASLALTRRAPDGREELQGCRLLRGTLEVALPADIRRVRLRAAGPPEGARLALLATPGATPLAELVLPPRSEAWSELEVAPPPGSTALRLRNDAAAQAPCLESLAFLREPPAAGR